MNSRLADDFQPPVPWVPEVKAPFYNPNNSFTLFLVFVLLDGVKERLSKADTVGTAECANNIVGLAVFFDMLR